MVWSGRVSLWLGVFRYGLVRAERPVWLKERHGVHWQSSARWGMDRQSSVSCGPARCGAVGCGPVRVM